MWREKYGIILQSQYSQSLKPRFVDLDKSASWVFFAFLIKITASADHIDILSGPCIRLFLMDLRWPGSLCFSRVALLLEEQLVVLLPELLDVERALFTVRIIKFWDFF